jgi:hypothetical protein
LYDHRAIVDVDAQAQPESDPGLSHASYRLSPCCYSNAPVVQADEATLVVRSTHENPFGRLAAVFVGEDDPMQGSSTSQVVVHVLDPTQTDLAEGILLLRTTAASATIVPYKQ